VRVEGQPALHQRQGRLSSEDVVVCGLAVLDAAARQGHTHISLAMQLHDKGTHISHYTVSPCSCTTRAHTYHTIQSRHAAARQGHTHPQTAGQRPCTTRLLCRDDLLQSTHTHTHTCVGTVGTWSGCPPASTPCPAAAGSVSRTPVHTGIRTTALASLQLLLSVRCIVDHPAQSSCL
jgi:hypothetical protein